MKRLATGDFWMVLGIVTALTSAAAAGLLLVDSAVAPAMTACRFLCG